MRTIKKILAVIFTLFAIFPAFSYSKKDLLRAVQSNDDSHVKKILSENSNFATAIFDSDKNSILMIALENNPSDNLIEILLRAGCSPDIKNIHGQTALMIACKNNCDSKTLEKIINFNSLTNIGKSNRILLKDKNGKCCFDYTQEGTEVYKTLTRYTQDPSKVPPKTKKKKNETPPEEVPEEETPEITEEELAAEPEAEVTAENTEDIAKTAAETEQEVSEIEITEQVPETEEITIAGTAAATAGAATAAIVPDEEEEEPVEEIPPEETEEEIELEEEPLAEESVEIADESTEEIEEEPVDEIEVIEEEPVEEVEVIEEEPVEEAEVIEEEPVDEVEVIEEVEETKTSHSIDYDENVNIPKIDYYNKNRPEYLFDEIDTDVTEVEEKPFKKIQNPNAADNAGRTRLMNAIMNNDYSLCYNLIESGARIDIRDKDGFTALMYACRYAKKSDIIELLFNHGAKLNDKSSFNLSVLQITAAYCESIPVLTEILNHAKTEKLSLAEPFVTALKTERPAEIIRQFIKYIPNINKTVNGKTPLMYAAENYESTDVIKLLLENGADPYIISTENKNAFSYAKENTKIKHDSIYWSLNVSSSRKR